MYVLDSYKVNPYTPILFIKNPVYNKAMAFEIILLIIILLLAPTTYAALRGAPLALTSKKRLRQMIKEIDIKPGAVFYDLGCGTGRVMVAVAQKTGWRVVGYELSPVFYLIAFLNLKIHRIKNFKLKYKDFFYADLKKADIVFLFLMPRSIKKIAPKLQQELRPKTKVISYCFAIQNWKPYKTIRDQQGLPVYFYRMSDGVNKTADTLSSLPGPLL